MKHVILYGPPAVDKPLLKSWLKRGEFFASMKGVASLEVDTDRLKPAQAAQAIAGALGLPMAAKPKARRRG